MTVRRMRIDAACPSCANPGLDYVAAPLEIPYFGSLIQTMLHCEACGFRHSDVIHGRTTDPRRDTLKVDGEDRLSGRVIRSTSCTVRIPELGARIEPGTNAEAYVTNVEGVLVRIQAIIEQLARDSQAEDGGAAARARLDDVAEAREGRFPFTLILEDPHGNSGIAHESTVREDVSAAEAADWARGEVTIDVADLVDLVDPHDAAT